MYSPTTDRDLVFRIAATDIERALRVTRGIEDPWYRCQALATVALHVPLIEERDKLLAEALASANLELEPNRIATVSSWPLKALTLSAEYERMATEADRLLAVIANESSPVRRADALRYVLGATIASKHPVIRRVASEFAKACLQPLMSGKRNRKGEYLLESVLPAIARVDDSFANELLQQLPPSRSERARKAIEDSQAKSLEELIPWPHLR